MFLIIIFSIIVGIILLSVVVFLFFDKEKSKHEIVLQNIQETIYEQHNISEKQRSQLKDLQNSSTISENSMRKVVDAFQDIPAVENDLLEKYLENLSFFSQNSLDLIKIYGRFVKVLS